MARVSFLILASLFVVFVQQGASAGSTPVPPHTPPSRMKICWFMFGTVDDLGWTFHVNLGRLAAHSTLSSEYPNVQFESIAIPDVYFGIPDNQKVEYAKSWIRSGCSVMMVIGTALIVGEGNEPYADPVIDLYPNVTWLFMTSNRTRTLETHRSNVAWFILDHSPAFYMAGVAAARQASTCVGILPAWEWLGNAQNAVAGFSLGVRSVNPDLPIHLVSMNSFFDPGAEIMANDLLRTRYGCEVSARYSDPRGADVHAASLKSSFMTIGTHADLQEYVGDSVLASIYVEWDVILLTFVRMVLNTGSINHGAGAPWGFGIHSGAVKISRISPQAKPGVQDAVYDAQALKFATNDSTVCGSLSFSWAPTGATWASGNCKSLIENPPGFLILPQTVNHGAFPRATDCAAGYSASYNTTTTIQLVCTACPANTFSPLPGSFQCTPCPGGLISTSASSNCSIPPAAIVTVVTEDSNGVVIGATVGSVLGVIVAILIGVLLFVRSAGAKKNARAPRNPPLALIFTDVESSTHLWNTYPDAMSKAMDIHHSVIRKVIEDNGGYEVKTIGDSFMIAAPTAIDALVIAVEIQLALHAADWPPQFHYEGQRELWNGLKVRIGVTHCTEVEVKFDPLHNYYDYYGNDVNVAARVESQAQGGQILVSQATLEVIRQDPDYSSMLEDDITATPFAEKVMLKGVAQEFTLFSIVPTKFSGRVFKPLEGHEKDFIKEAFTTGTGDGHSSSDQRSSGGQSSDGGSPGMDAFFGLLSTAARHKVLAIVAAELKIELPANIRRAQAMVAREVAIKTVTQKHAAHHSSAQLRKVSVSATPNA